MGLIRCLKCESQVSEHSVQCVVCGLPVSISQDRRPVLPTNVAALTSDFYHTDVNGQTQILLAAFKGAMGLTIKAPVMYSNLDSLTTKDIKLLREFLADKLVYTGRGNLTAAESIILPKIFRQKEIDEFIDESDSVLLSIARVSIPSWTIIFSVLAGSYAFYQEYAVQTNLHVSKIDGFSESNSPLDSNESTPPSSDIDLNTTNQSSSEVRESYTDPYVNTQCKTCGFGRFWANGECNMCGAASPYLVRVHFAKNAVPCIACNATGWQYDQVCSLCHGEGRRLPY